MQTHGVSAMFREREDPKDRISAFKSFNDSREKDTECICVSLETELGSTACVKQSFNWKAAQ